MLFSDRFAILYTVILICFRCSGSDNNEGQAAANGSVDAIAVETVVIEEREVTDVIEATGTIAPLHDALVSSMVAGIVERVAVEVGDKVGRDQELVIVDDELSRLAVQQAEARALEAEAAYEKSRKDFERNETLFKSQDISEFVFENARLQKESAHAALKMAQANLKIARRQLRDTRIVSPVGGFVAARLVELGATVAPGTPVARIIDIDKVKVKIGVPESDIVRIAKGQAARIRVDSMSGTDFEGTVSAVGPQADLTSRAFPVEILVENPDFRLKAGMVASVVVQTTSAQSYPMLPKSALLERSGRTLVYLVKSGTAEQREPELGLEAGDFIAVRSGIAAGEEVVVLGQEQLADGAAVVVHRR